MENAIGILWGITLVIAIIAFLDWRGRRRKRLHGQDAKVRTQS